MTDFFSGAARRVYEEYEERNQREQALQRTLAAGEGFARRNEFLLPLGKEAATALHSLILALGSTSLLELGTSYGYSTLFLADAAKKNGGRLVTMELDSEKQAFARSMLEKAGVADVVDWRLGDAVEMIRAEDRIFDFVLVDIWKELYLPCFEAVYPKLKAEGVLASDNMIHPAAARENVRRYREAVCAAPDMQTALLPIGSGIEISVRWPAGSDKL